MADRIEPTGESQVKKLAVLKRFLMRHRWTEIRTRKQFAGVNLYEWMRTCRKQYRGGVLSAWLVEELDGLNCDWRIWDGSRNFS